MIYKLVSSKRVIAKVFADLDLKEGSHRISDWQEWIAEAVEKIGSVRQLTRKVSEVDGVSSIQIKGHQAQLPCDLFRLNQVAYGTKSNGPWFPMRLATGNFNMWSSNEQTTVDGMNVPESTEAILDMVKILYGKYVEDPVYSWFSKMDYATALEILNTNTNARVLLTNLIRANNTDASTNSSIELKYSIKPGYIVTNLPTGYLKLSYDAVPIDDDGYPLIPDTMSYIEAIYWYVVVKLKYPDYIAGRLRGDVYGDMRQSWNFYCKQAYAESMMPGADEMESIKNTWNRLIPVMNAHDSFYDGISNPERIKNHNNR